MPHRSLLDSPHFEDTAMGDTVAGAVNYRGQPASRAATGGWKSSIFVMAMEIAERFAYKGVAANLITYLTGPLGQPMASAAASIDAWKGVSQMLPLPVACVADAWLGRYRAIILASIIFVLSMGTLSLSSAFHIFRSGGHVAVFYVALYLVALGEGAHKPCAQAFAADQFDEKDPKENVARSSFFNWWYFGMCAGTAVTTMVSSYVQDNVGWGLGFGIPCIVIAVSLALFLIGTPTYRYYTTKEPSPVARVGKAFLVLIKSWRSKHRTNPASGKVEGKENSDDLVEEVKSVFRLLPIWASCIIYAIIFSQTSTFFTKQAATMDRRIGPKFKVPPAALQTFISVSIVVFIPVYDRLFVPLARRYTGRPTGITMLQRVGAGLCLSLVAVVLSALVEMKRLQVARDAGLVNSPKAQLPMTLWWMVPQYVLIGVSDVFAMIGLQEFFYDQVPDAVRSLGLALFLSIFGVGHLLSSFLISVIDRATAKRGASWFSNNLNRAHLDYFYWLLAGLCVLELLAFFFFSRAYVYKKKGGDGEGNADYRGGDADAALV
ncbi:protein NRT1/ PTR FAMILY 5.10 [Lolium perenne]|uniref:protein NRT1/ PTR FAMILY 5.10 n=1 Tax=Lolium perenne TaxID=4522 RepID=UPI0021EAB95E|nr:protein NRT1/ PTR FAMILY 5.10-like [Lolium perenne]